MTDAVDKEREGVTPSEAFSILLKPLEKLYHTTGQLKPSEHNNEAVKLLSQCYQSLSAHIPGAEYRSTSDSKVAQSIQMTNAYANQIKQGQTIFSAPSGEASSSADEHTETRINSFKH